MVQSVHTRYVRLRINLPWIWRGPPCCKRKQLHLITSWMKTSRERVTKRGFATMFFDNFQTFWKVWDLNRMVPLLFLLLLHGSTLTESFQTVNKMSRPHSQAYVSDRFHSVWLHFMWVSEKFHVPWAPTTIKELKPKLGRTFKSLTSLNCTTSTIIWKSVDASYWGSEVVILIIFSTEKYTSSMVKTHHWADEMNKNFEFIAVNFQRLFINTLSLTFVMC